VSEPSVIAPTLVPSVAYDDLVAAIRWLTEVLGLRAASVYGGPDGAPVFAELAWRTGVVFAHARPPADNPWAAAGPASIALVAEDAGAVDRQYRRALAAGAEILRPPHVARTPAFPDGSHQFDLRDPAGNFWTIGTFQPRIPAAPGGGER